MNKNISVRMIILIIAAFVIIAFTIFYSIKIKANKEEIKTPTVEDNTVQTVVNTTNTLKDVDEGINGIENDVSGIDEINEADLMIPVE